MPLESPPAPVAIVAPASPAVQIGGYAGIAHAFGADVVDDVVMGARVGRGLFAGVAEARVSLAPEELDPLAVGIAEIFGYQQMGSSLPSLSDRWGVALAAEVGAPTFGRRFSGGPFAQVGVDLSMVHRAWLSAVSGTTAVQSAEDLLVPGLRVAAGATWSLGTHAALRLDVGDTMRAASLLDAPSTFNATSSFLHQTRVTATVMVGR